MMFIPQPKTHFLILYILKAIRYISSSCGPIQTKSCVVDDSVLLAALLPGAELRNDSFLCPDDLEGSDGCHWQRESYCSCSQVSLSHTNGKINNLISSGCG